MAHHRRFRQRATPSKADYIAATVRAFDSDLQKVVGSIKTATDTEGKPLYRALAEKETNRQRMSPENFASIYCESNEEKFRLLAECQS
jgi:hypothetical protein